jgi:DNA-binding protein HU-beta
MNKSELIAQVAETLEVPKTRVAAVLNAALDLVVEKVSAGETVGITGFGTFSSRDRAERNGRNPQTGEALTIEARKAPHFRSGRSFKDAVNA